MVHMLLRPVAADAEVTDLPDVNQTCDTFGRRVRPRRRGRPRRRFIYAACKGAVEVLTRYMARELGPRQITVNTVAPGATATDFLGAFSGRARKRRN